MDGTRGGDRDLAIEAVRVTEAAARAATHYMGGGDEKAADEAAAFFASPTTTSSLNKGELTNFSPK